jgi:hypothetical protein
MAVLGCSQQCLWADPAYSTLSGGVTSQMRSNTTHARVISKRSSSRGNQNAGHHSHPIQIQQNGSGQQISGLWAKKPAGPARGLSPQPCASVMHSLRMWYPVRA